MNKFLIDYNIGTYAIHFVSVGIGLFTWGVPGVNKIPRSSEINKKKDNEPWTYPLSSSDGYKN